MAVIRVAKSDAFPVCGLAAWALDNLVRDVKPDLPAGGGLEAAFARKEETKLEWLNLENVDDAEMATFAAVLRAYLRRLEDQGSSALATPEAVPGYLAKITQLLELVERRLA